MDKKSSGHILSNSISGPHDSFELQPVKARAIKIEGN
jgi:hypothetical protein